MICNFLAVTVLAGAAFARNHTCTFPPLYSASLDDLAQGLENGCFSSIDLVNAYSRRIVEVNTTLHAVLELNPDALSVAAALDAERALGMVRSPLHGIPILVKDNIATFDLMDNTAGSYALVGAKVPCDSGVVKRLRAAGAIILGKTNMSQWAMFRSGNTTSGWSSVGGQTYGAFYPQQDPCGSSSGSGVAAGIGLSFAALGTETQGSILEPASRSNSVGIKPTVGLTSRYLVIPITEFQDTVGPLARTVRDAAAVLSVIAGTDEHDNGTLSIPKGGVIPDYVAAANRYTSGLHGVRIGVPRNAYDDDDLLYQPVNKTIVLESFNRATEVLKNLGAEIVDPANFSADTVASIDVGFSSSKTSNESISCGAGFISGLAAYLGQLSHNPSGIHSVADLLNYTEHDPREDWPDRNAVAWQGALERGYGTDDPRALAAIRGAAIADQEGGVTGLIRDLELDALIIPTDWAPTWASSPGLPAVGVPLGVYPPGTPVINGLRELVAVAPGIPYGLSFLGQKWSEETLIGIAHAFEQAHHIRATFEPGKNATLPTVELKDVC